MKFYKILVLIFFLCLWILSVNANTITEKVFQINWYWWDWINNTFVKISQWSAVLIQDNKILTNSHVVIWESNKPIKNLELCISKDFREQPTCKYVLKLLYFDIEKDLALLEIEWEINTKPVIMNNSDLWLWEFIQVYDYPWNWWKTITLTEWKISWFADWMYKIDANMDFGNSGWWWFNKQWELIWIPSIVYEWITSLWYMIPVSTIKTFLSEIKTINYDINEWFRKFVQKKYEILSQKQISNDFFELGDYTKYWLQLESVDFSTDWKFFSYQLISKSQKTITTVKNQYKFDKKMIKAKTEKEYLQNRFKWVSVQDLILWWQDVRLLVMVWEKNEIWEIINPNKICIQILAHNNSFNITIDSTTEQIQNDIKNILLRYFKTIKFIWTSQLSKNIFSNSLYQITPPEDFYITQEISNEYLWVIDLSFSINPNIPNDWLIYAEKRCEYNCLSNTSMEDYINALTNNIIENWFEILDNLIITNTNWVDFWFYKAKLYSLNSYNAVFWTSNADWWSVYEIVISIVLKKTDDNKKIRKIFLDLAKDIKLNWTYPFLTNSN